VSFFKSNIDRRGRLVRAGIGLVCLTAGLILLSYISWFGIILMASGVFALFEAARGWCVARACGIKTKV
jgi:Inner membrane protein YgaP-like, transmembrane domain